MGNSCEIKFVDYELQNEKGNLRNLYAKICEAPKINKNPMKESIGRASQKINANCTIAYNTQEVFQTLLSNSVSFFEELGISFTDADKKCADAIRKETSQYNTMEGIDKHESGDGIRYDEK